LNTEKRILDRYEETEKYIKENCYGYKEEGITLSSGKTSKHYFNLRKLLLNPVVMQLYAMPLIYSYIEEIRKIYKIRRDINCIAGLTMGADPITYNCSFYSSSIELGLGQSEYPILHPLIVRKEAKNHGTKSLIEGVIPKNPVCIVVDDVITSGASTLKAVKALREAGVDVMASFCVLDREEGGKEALNDEGLPLYSIYKKSDFGVGE
jgi:orotate phosphoribosyltransferase